jgi:hypothetical protein
VNCTESLVKNVRDLRIQRDNYSDWAKAGTFLGALTAGGAAMFKGPRDLIVGSGLFGATSYELGNLFSPKIFGSILNAGLNASLCVNSVAVNMQAATRTVTGRSTALREAKVKVERWSNSLTVSPNVKRDAKAAIERANSVLLLADSTLNSVSQLAASIRTSADAIAYSIDTQLRDNAPDLDAFKRASDAVLSKAKSLVPSPPATTGATDKGSKKGLAGARDDEAATQDIIALVTITDQLAASIAQFSGFDPSSCPQKALAGTAEALSAKPAKVALKVNAPMNVTVRGGQPSYHGHWQGAEPAAAEIEVKQGGSVFRFERKSVLPTPVAYVYEVVDQLGKVVEIEIE